MVKLSQVKLSSLDVETEAKLNVGIGVKEGDGMARLGQVKLDKEMRGDRS